MRKLVFLIVLAAMIISCSKDDNGNEEPKQDPLIGNWQITSQKFDDKPVVNECMELELITVKADGTLSQKDYDKDGMNECVLEETISGTWKNKGNGIYNIVTGDLDLDYAVTFSGNTLTAVATRDGNTLEIKMKKV